VYRLTSELANTPTKTAKSQTADPTAKNPGKPTMAATIPPVTAPRIGEGLANPTTVAINPEPTSNRRIEDRAEVLGLVAF
jgi:hypothetical protein